MLREALIFGTSNEPTVKEGLLFWTVNRYRNYLDGVASVPNFIGEYVPQQTHFDALFHILFTKRTVLTLYLREMEILVQSIHREYKQSIPSYIMQAVNFNDQIDDDLKVLTKHYLKKDFSNLGYFPTIKSIKDGQYSDHNDLLGLTSRSINGDITSFFTPKNQIEIHPELSKHGFGWFIGNSPSPPYNPGSKTIGYSASFFRNHQSASERIVSMLHVYTIENNDITKNYYKGFNNADTYSTPTNPDTPYDLVLNIPVSGYKVTLKDSNDNIVKSNILDEKPTCIGVGMLHRRNNTDNYKNDGCEPFVLGEFSGDRTKRNQKDIGSPQKVYIDQRTAKVLGGDDRVLSVDIQEVVYMYYQQFLDKSTQGYEDHTHTLKVQTFDQPYIPGHFDIKNIEWNWNFWGRAYKFYQYLNLRFTDADLRKDSGRALKDYTLPAYFDWQGIKRPEVFVHLNYNRANDYLKGSEWRLPNSSLGELYNTVFSETRIRYDRLYSVYQNSPTKTTSTMRNTNYSYHRINNIDVELTVYDPVTSIGKALIGGLKHTPLTTDS